MGGLGFHFAQKVGALPFSRSLREGGAFRGQPATARLVDFVFPVFVRHSGNLAQEVVSFPCHGDLGDTSKLVTFISLRSVVIAARRCWEAREHATHSLSRWKEYVVGTDST